MSVTPQLRRRGLRSTSLRAATRYSDSLCKKESQEEGGTDSVWLGKELSNPGYISLNPHARDTGRLCQTNKDQLQLNSRGLSKFKDLGFISSTSKLNKNKELRITKAFVTDVCWRVEEWV